MSRYSIYKNKILEDIRSSKFKFNNDRRIYYVYRVTDLTLNEHYYGSRIAKQTNILEDFASYCTSSKRKNIIKENYNNYKVKIIKTFTNQDEMLLYESFLHDYFNVKIKGNSFFNEANQTPFGFYSSKTYIRSNKIKEEHSLFQNSLKKGTNLTNAQNAGLKTSKTMQRLGTTVGSKNPRALKINIFDNNNNLIYECNGNLKEVCKNNKLPFSAFRTSYLNAEKVYETVTSKGGAIKQLKAKGYYRYKDWYAIKF